MLPRTHNVMVNAVVMSQFLHGPTIVSLLHTEVARPSLWLYDPNRPGKIQTTHDPRMRLIEVNFGIPTDQIPAFLERIPHMSTTAAPAQMHPLELQRSLENTFTPVVVPEAKLTMYTEPPPPHYAHHPPPYYPGMPPPYYAGMPHPPPYYAPPYYAGMPHPPPYYAPPYHAGQAFPRPMLPTPPVPVAMAIAPQEPDQMDKTQQDHATFNVLCVQYATMLKDADEFIPNFKAYKSQDTDHATVPIFEKAQYPLTKVESNAMWIAEYVWKTFIPHIAQHARIEFRSILQTLGQPQNTTSNAKMIAAIKRAKRLYTEHVKCNKKCCVATPCALGLPNLCCCLFFCCIPECLQKLF